MGSLRVYKSPVNQDTNYRDIEIDSLIETEDAVVGYIKTEPNSTSDWHHHGDYDIATYIISGTILFEFGTSGEQKINATTGDLVHVPKQTVHRESNPTDHTTLTLLVRIGRGRSFYRVNS